MPSYARKYLVPEGADCVVHTISRCVRRAMLCGYDAHDGRSYEHRRDWVQERVRHLAGVFAVEVCAYAIMSNHSHLVLWCRPSQAAEWSEFEVARRWLTLFGRVGHTPTDAECQRAASNLQKVEIWRGRLGSVSWFMRCLNEWVARRANAEDECTGRFWEGRFKCQLLEDEGAVLACMAYVDLNPVRAKLADSLETSIFASIHDRLVAMKARAGLSMIGVACAAGAATSPVGVADCLDPAEAPMLASFSPSSAEEKLILAARAQSTADAWLCPIGAAEGFSTILSLTLEDYINLLDWTGRQLSEGKRGALDPEMAPVLQRMQIATRHWLAAVGEFGAIFHRVVGKPTSMAKKARQMNQQWLAGMRASRAVFWPEFA